MEKYFITTSIPYVNANPHIGHALEFVQADVLARFNRLRGKDLFFLSGTDDNALKNVQAANEAGIPIKEWVDSHAEVFKKLLKALSISNDDFIRTSAEERHIKGARKLWESCKKEDIYKKKYKGLYCLGCEEFKSIGDLKDGQCAEHPGKKLEEVEEENYFFRLSKYQNQLREIIASRQIKIVPESRKNETLGFIESGLEDFSISRSRERAKGWGVEVPGDPSQIMYVWFDALSNYINALGYADNGENFQKYWQNGNEIIHVIGKGINRFHTIYWPAMLISAGINLPKTVFIHGYLTINGQKISKSLGNVIDPFEVIKKYEADATRYYLLREISSYDDGDFSYEKFEERYNSDLANGLGNFAARVLALGEKLGTLETENLKIEPEIEQKINSAQKELAIKIAEFKFHEALSAIWELISFGDKYINDQKPWQNQPTTNDQRPTTILNLIVILDNVAALLRPFLPNTAEKLTQAILWTSQNTLQIKKIDALFPRI